MPRPASKLIEAVSGGWPRILSNLKSLLETGAVVMAEKWPNAAGRAASAPGAAQSAVSL
jgi:hypothetical protein